MCEFTLLKLELYDQKIFLNKKIDLAFYIIELAAKNRIGVNFNWNIYDRFEKRLNDLKQNEILIELTDNPLDKCSLEMFMGKSFPNYEKRMKHIQTFLEKTFELNEVKKMILDICAYPTEEEIIKYKVPVINIYPKDFCKIISELHDKNNQDIPLIRIIMNKNKKNIKTKK